MRIVQQLLNLSSQSIDRNHVADVFRGCKLLMMVFDVP